MHVALASNPRSKPLPTTFQAPIKKDKGLINFSAQYRVITRNFSSLNYKTQRATQNYLKYSYFHRVVSTWNSLPLDIKSSTNLVTFKKAISDYYTMKLDSYILPDERRT